MDELISTLLSGQLDRILPIGIFLGVVLAICVMLVQTLLSGVDGAASEAGRIAAIIAGFIIAYVILSTEEVSDWSMILQWAIVAVTLIEIPKTLRELSLARLAARLGIVLVLSYTLIVSLMLNRGQAVLSDPMTVGLLFGCLFSFSFFGSTPLFRLMQILRHRFR